MEDRQAQERDDGGDADRPRKRAAIDAGIQHGADSPFEA